MKPKSQRKAIILSKILANYSEETQEILKDDPRYFKKILKERNKFIEILRSLESDA